MPRPHPLRWTPALGLLLVAASSLAGQQRAPDPFAAVRRHIVAAVTDSGLPSLAVGVAHRGRVLWLEGFGWADRERRVRATEHTMYSLASISKPITATGLMLLHERGRFRLDAPVNTYLGPGMVRGLAGDAAGATVRRIANHTAGLPLHYMFYYAGAGDRELSMDEVIGRYGITVYPPGSAYQYSNLGFGILDWMITRLSGVDYADFMRAEVFLPLGMTRTSIHLPDALREFAAVRYDPQGRRVPWYDFDHDGGSAVWSSAHDLLRFGMFHLKNRVPEMKRILADSTVDAMHVNTTGVPGSGYGIGWAITEDHQGLRRVSHTGGMPGVNTALYLYPTEDLAVVTLANASGPFPYTIADAIVATLVPRFRDTLLARRGRATPPGAPTPFAAPAALRGEWAGTLTTWEGQVPLTLTFQADGDVVTRIGNAPRALLWDTAWQRDSVFVGRASATIPTEDARTRVHTVLFSLTLRNGVLSGQASAQTIPPETVYFAKTSYVELRRR